MNIQKYELENDFLKELSDEDFQHLIKNSLKKKKIKENRDFLFYFENDEFFFLESIIFILKMMSFSFLKA